MQPLGRMLLLTGAVLVLVGILLLVSDRIPFLGKLPGDFMIRRGNFRIFIPMTTSVLLSFLITAVLWLFSYFKGK